MNIIELNGDWSVQQSNGELSLKAHVPGVIHTDLLRAKRIDDPFFRDNELKQLWVGESEWIYQRTVSISSEFLQSHPQIQLECDGLDTLADILINGKKIASTDNQFKKWQFDIKSYLHEGENSIQIIFHSAVDYVTKKQEERFVWHTGLGEGAEKHRINGGNRIRKSQSNFGWDWGPMCVTAGIWRPIRIVGYDAPHIEFVQSTQTHSKDFSEVTLELSADTLFDELSTDDSELVFDVMFHDEVLDTKRIPFHSDSKKTSFLIKNPKLWWPNGMGDQNLYTFKVSVKQKNTIASEYKRTIGLRELKLEQKKDEFGLTFQFVANGQPFFAKGANWIPADVFVSAISKEKYKDLVLSTKRANMNMLRVWGGGIYEDEVFYDLCDEYGICVWQDFMFSCGAYPVFEKDFVENVRSEAIQETKRLHHRACLALWCGNNEIEDFWDNTIGTEPGKMSWEEYTLLFDKLLPEIVSTYSPQVDYIPSSAHSPCGERKNTVHPECGDSHLWDVWFYREPFEWYRTSKHRFCSEFGFQSFPQPSVVRGFTEEQDRNITSYVMEHHQRSAIGNEAIIQYMCRWFRIPKDFEMMLWLSQILQGIAMKYGVDHWRRSMPQSMGTLYWQLNDCWPGPSWSSIDSQGNWKALHYMAKRFNNPVSLSILEQKDGTFELHVVSDLMVPFEGKIKYSLIHVDGTIIDSQSKSFKMEPTKSKKIDVVDFGTIMASYDKKDVIISAELEKDGQIVSSDISFYLKPKHLNLRDPAISFELKQISEKKFEITLTSKAPALWAWVDVADHQIRFSDLFMHILPGKEYVIEGESKDALDISILKKKLNVLSLFNSY